MKLKIQIIVGLLLIALSASSAYARGGACPAFNAGMVDSAFLAGGFSQEEPVEGYAVNDPELPFLYCALDTEDRRGWFSVFLGQDHREPSGNKAHLNGANSDVETWLRTSRFHLSEAELRACRAQVVASFVWTQYCLPLMQ